MKYVLMKVHAQVNHDLTEKLLQPVHILFPHLFKKILIKMTSAWVASLHYRFTVAPKPDRTGNKQNSINK